jgi:glucosamine-6-phosphate deaminase
MGQAAADHVHALLRGILAAQKRARVVFACAPSQNEFLEALLSPERPALDWSRIQAFHMDEYAGLSAEHPASFRHYLHAHLLSRVQPEAFAPLRGEAGDGAAECLRYTKLLREAPIDLVCLGIGENGHLAFNDPPIADFEDPADVKLVELDLACRQQQVHDGCFLSLAEVPTQALTLTLPVFLRAAHLSVVVPGPRKAPAVQAALQGPITPQCPASALRLRPRVHVFLDAPAAGLLSPTVPA